MVSNTLCPYPLRLTEIPPLTVLQVLFKRKPVQFVQAPRFDDDSQEVGDLILPSLISAYTVYMHKSVVDLPLC